MSSKLIANAAVFSLAVLMFPGAGAIAKGVKNDLPLAVQQATDLGAVNPDEELNLTVHLKMPNKEAFDQAVGELYNPQSATYGHWMTDADMQKYAPGAGAMAAVKAELVKNGFLVVSIDPLGFSIRVHGTVANAQNAFQTQIHQYAFKQQTFRAHLQPAVLSGGADKFVYTVAGLDGRKVHHMAKFAANPLTGKPFPKTPLSKVEASGLSSIITDQCFTGPSTFTIDTPGSALPVGVYFGNVYDNTTKACSFTSKQLEAHYGLPAAYAKGFDGTGQTIVLNEAYGYPTLEDDANAFSKLNGLPALDASNFEIVYPQGKPLNPNAGVDAGWDVEIALDVQWAHTIAPNAKIIVVATYGQDSEDFQDSINYIVAHKLGYTVSDSWEEDTEQFAGPAEVDSFNTVLEKAAAKGVSVNFSSGDSGDDGNGSPIGAPEVPADSLYGTAVGGTSILNSINGSSMELGWGTAEGQVGYMGPNDPPFAATFAGGAGGGESVFNAKPKWQSSLAGTGRQVPDVSALSDPYTGVFIVLTSLGTQYVEPGWGGTSLGCPIFSAFWALADQAAGHPLGQAGPKLAKLTGPEINDILPLTSVTNVAGTVFDSNGATYYSPYDLFAPAIVPPTVNFVSSIWPLSFGGTTAYLTVGFALDSSLSVEKGWDNVTGFGAPNGLPFIQALAK